LAIVPPGLCWIILSISPLSLQHYCPTFALYHSNFFSSLLYCLFHSMLLVMCGGGGGGRHVPHWEPTTRKPVIYRSSTVGGLFVRFSSAIVYRA
jgi:hypothetical protein